MTQDVRAYIYCSLGEVISGDISESSIVDAGLVKVSGTIILNGVYAPQRGQIVMLGYYKQGKIGAIGRKLRVLGYYANTITRTTEVSVGCYLTYHSETAPFPVTLNSQETEDDLQLSELEKLALINPTSAATVFNYCCNFLGITADICPLTNQFFIDKFPIEGNLIDLISDLLKSENYVGYLDASEQLRYISLAEPITRGPVITEDIIIDISPIQSNLTPADIVYSNVPYRQIKLDTAIDSTAAGVGDDYDSAYKSVEKRSSPYVLYGYEQTHIASKREYRWEDPETGIEYIRTLIWYPKTDWVAYYDNEGRMYYKDEFSRGAWGITHKSTYIKYWGDDGFEYQEEFNSELGPGEEGIEAIGFPEEVLVPLPNNISSAVSDYGYLLTDRNSYRRTESTPTSVSTVYYEYVDSIFTSDGAGAIKAYMDSFSSKADISIGAVIDMARSDALNNSQSSYETKKPDFNINEGSDFSFLSRRSSDNESTDLGRQADKDATYVTNIETKVEILFSTNTTGGVVVEYTPPYLSDDKVVRAVNGGFEVIPSDAPLKARVYATVQNRLHLGQLNGQSVVLPIEYIPSIPFNPVYLDFSGVVGQYRFDKATIAFDNTGILFSADCLFWGGVGQ